jgi:hypothetical protein
MSRAGWQAQRWRSKPRMPLPHQERQRYCTTHSLLRFRYLQGKLQNSIGNRRSRCTPSRPVSTQRPQLPGQFGIVVHCIILPRNLQATSSVGYVSAAAAVPTRARTVEERSIKRVCVSKQTRDVMCARDTPHDAVNEMLTCNERALRQSVRRVVKLASRVTCDSRITHK